MQLIATVKAIVPSPPFFLVVPLAISADGHDKADKAGQSLSQRTTERFLVGELPMVSCQWEVRINSLIQYDNMK